MACNGRAGRSIYSPKEFSLLELLMRHAGQPVSRPAIVEQVWKLNCDTVTNLVDVYISTIFGAKWMLVLSCRLFGLFVEIGGNGTAV